MSASDDSVVDEIETDQIGADAPYTDEAQDSMSTKVPAEARCRPLRRAEEDAGAESDDDADDDMTQVKSDDDEADDQADEDESAVGDDDQQQRRQADREGPAGLLRCPDVAVVTSA